MTTNISKYGFFAVICIHEDGSKSLCHSYDEREMTDCAEFKSEKAADWFVKYAQEKASQRGSKAQYYRKYVSWSMYD
jgi:hypothetical protein